MPPGASVWATLPGYDVFSCVVAKLLDRADLASVNLVSRAWHAGIHRHLPYLGLLVFPSRQPVNLATQLGLYTGVTFLKLEVRIPLAHYRDIFYQHMVQALAAHPALRRLYLLDEEMDVDSFRQLGSLTRLQSLYLNGDIPGFGWQDGTALALFSDLTGLTQLSLHAGGEQRNIEVLRRMPLLQSLFFRVHPEADVSPLSSLHHLTNMEVRGASAHSRQQFSQLTSLQCLQRFDITDDTSVRYLSTLRRLCHLELQQSTSVTIASLDALQHLHRLNYLQLHLYQAVNLPSLAPLSVLRHLEISTSSEAPFDTRPLAGLACLDELLFYGGKMLHVTSLSGLASLQHIELNSEGLDDLEWVSRLARLRSMQLDQPLEADLAPLAALGDLEALELYGADTCHMDGLAGLTSLRSLSVLEGRFADLGFVSGLQSLEHLKLRYARALADISALQALPALRDLELAYCPMVDWSAIAGMTALDTLNVRDNLIADITLLSRLTNLRTLNIPQTPVAMDRAAVCQMLPNLKRLWSQ